MSKQVECPRCGKLFERKYGALSRKDNKTVICSECGTMEAMEEFVNNTNKGDK